MNNGPKGVSISKKQFEEKAVKLKERNDLLDEAAGFEQDKDYIQALQKYKTALQMPIPGISQILLISVAQDVDTPKISEGIACCEAKIQQQYQEQLWHAVIDIGNQDLDAARSKIECAKTLLTVLGHEDVYGKISDLEQRISWAAKKPQVMASYTRLTATKVEELSPKNLPQHVTALRECLDLYKSLAIKPSVDESAQIARLAATLEAAELIFATSQNLTERAVKLVAANHSCKRLKDENLRLENIEFEAEMKRFLESAQQSMLSFNTKKALAVLEKARNHCVAVKKHGNIDPEYKYYADLGLYDSSIGILKAYHKSLAEEPRKTAEYLIKRAIKQSGLVADNQNMLDRNYNRLLEAITKQLITDWLKFYQKSQAELEQIFYQAARLIGEDLVLMTTLDQWYPHNWSTACFRLDKATSWQTHINVRARLSLDAMHAKNYDFKLPIFLPTAEVIPMATLATDSRTVKLDKLVFGP